MRRILYILGMSIAFTISLSGCEDRNQTTDPVKSDSNEATTPHSMDKEP